MPATIEYSRYAYSPFRGDRAAGGWAPGAPARHNMLVCSDVIRLLFPDGVLSPAVSAAAFKHTLASAVRHRGAQAGVELHA